VRNGQVATGSTAEFADLISAITSGKIWRESELASAK